MANAGNNQQGPDPPQPQFRLPAAADPSPSFSTVLDVLGLHSAAVAVRQTPNLTSEYDIGAFVRGTIQDSALFDAVWETLDTINSAFANQGVALRELNKTNDELRAELTALQAQFNDVSGALTAAPPTVTAVSAAGPYMSSIGHDPAGFNGSDMDPIQRRIAYKEWRSRILIRWAVDEHDFPTEFKKILHIASLLSGSTFQYVRADIGTIVCNREDTTLWKWQSGADLLKTRDDLYDQNL